LAPPKLHWIDKHAEEGPVFRIGDKDIYSRPRKNQRVLRLHAITSPGLDYVEPALEGFHALAELWGAPIVYIIDPDVKQPPAARFLFEWSRRAFENGSVDRSYMVMHNRLTHMLGRFVCRTFTDGGMPFEAIQGEDRLQSTLDALDLTCPREDFTLAPRTTALALRRGVGDGLAGNLVQRLLSRLRGRPRTPE